MTDKRGSQWAPRVGWTLVALVFVFFVWGLERRARLETAREQVIRMLFVPSVEQGTLVQRGDELARFIREDSGLSLRSEVPTSYAAVIQALGSGQADVAWMPAFAYVIANARYGAEARLQVVRSADRFAILVARSGAGAPRSLDELDRPPRVAVPGNLRAALRQRMAQALDGRTPGWSEIPVTDDREAVRALLERPLDVDLAASSYVESGPNDFVGDGRKELEYERPGTLAATRVVYTTERAVPESNTVYYGCIYSRADSDIRRLEDLAGRRFAFSDETSTSGHIFPRMLLDSRSVTLGRVYYAGGHPNVIQAVWDGKADGGSAFYSPPSAQQREEGLAVGDARYLILKRMAEPERRRAFLEQVRILALTDPIPNDLCATRQGFSPELWRRFEESLQRFLTTEQGRSAFFDLLAGVAAAPTEDRAFDGFRDALETAGMSAEGLLEAAEEKLEADREGDGP